jgi:hypothetical protein
MWQQFVLIIADDSLQLEFPAVPTPLLKLLESPDAFTASNNNLWWQRPFDELWLNRAMKLAQKYGARVEDFRHTPSSSDQQEPKKVEEPAPTQSASNSSKTLDELLYKIQRLEEELSELKKFDAIASEKLSYLKLSLESDRKPKAKTRTTSRGNGRTK